MTDTSDRASRAAAAVLGLVLPVLSVASGLGALVLTWNDLPHPLATHWGPGGEPDGSMPTWMFAGVVVATTVLPAIGLVLLARRARRTGAVRGELTMTAAGCGFVAGLGGSLAIVTVSANAGAPAWTAAAPIGPGAVVGSVLAALACGAVAAVAARRLEQPPTDAGIAGDLPSVGLRPGERAQWIGRCRSSFARPMTLGFGVGAVLTGVLGLVRGAPVLWVVALAFAVVAAAVLPFVSIRVTADRRGLRVEYGPFGWPVTTIELDRVSAARAVDDLVPMRAGGWGYRGGLHLVGRAAVVLRRGPALQVDLVSGGTFVVTVDDATTGAGVLNDLTAERSRE